MDRCGAGREHRERERFIDNLLVRIHFIIVMIRWTGLAPWEFEFPFPGSLTSKPYQNETGESGGGHFAGDGSSSPELNLELNQFT